MRPSPLSVRGRVITPPVPPKLREPPLTARRIDATTNPNPRPHEPQQ